jgi:hypothetical protein
VKQFDLNEIPPLSIVTIALGVLIALVVFAPILWVVVRSAVRDGVRDANRHK